MNYFRFWIENFSLDAGRPALKGLNIIAQGKSGRTPPWGNKSLPNPIIP
jgi:hypothetical protein